MNQRPTILIVDDEPFNIAVLEQELDDLGYDTISAGDGQAALDQVRSEAPDLVLLDIMMPVMDGFAVLSRLKASPSTRDIPVIVISANHDMPSVVKGIKQGAEDYLPKPFALEELIARVHALVRRGGDVKSPILRVGDLTLDTISRVAERGGRKIELTTREYRLLEYLMRSTGRVCSRMMILEKVWEYHFDPGSNLVDVYVGKLREKIDADRDVKLLHSVRGEGYVIKEGE